MLQGAIDENFKTTEPFALIKTMLCVNPPDDRLQKDRIADSRLMVYIS
jgi:hypothetical protein